MGVTVRWRYAGMSDEDLMDRASGGDTRAFAAVFDRHADMAFSLAYRMCGRRPMAEDIVQDAFLSLWRSTARYDSARGTVRSWVLAAVHNRAVDTFRREQAKTSKSVNDDALVEQLEGPDRTEREAERRDETRKVREALGGLPDEQRRVIELAYFGGFSQSEIGDMLGLPIGTVKGRMRLGMAKLRVSLAETAAVI
jgi:RNA polymerase sigma-70 factor, ECF subfamily